MQSLAFNKFQPICDRIIRQRSTQDVATLYEMVKETEAYYLQNIQQFLLVPLITRMGEADSGKQPRERSDIKVKIIGVVKLVLEKTELRQVHALKTILIVLTKEVYEFQTAQLVPNVSEELIIGVLGCISVANRRASSDSVEQFFQPENASQICQIMYVILLLLDKSDFREIKLKALEALMSLLHVNDGSDLSDIVLRNQISGIIFFAVPMIWTSLSKPILNDPKIGRQVIERSLIALGRILCLIMEDDKARDEERQEQLNSNDFRALIISSSHPPANTTSILEQKEKKRTPEWLRAAGNKLKEPFKSLITLTGNESQGIRNQVGLCCEQWMRRCRYSLEDNMDTFAEIVLILSEDEDPQISSYFSRVLNDLQGNGGRSFTTINRDLIERHLLRMSRIIHRQSEKEQYTALALLKAQLKGLPAEELVLLFSNSRSLEVFVRNLLLLIEFNYDNPVLLKEEHTIRDYVDNDAPAGVTKPWEDFKYFNAKSSKVPLLLLNIMKSVRGRTSVRILIEYLTSLLKDRPANCAEILKLLQLIVSSISPADDQGVEMVERLFEELLDDRYWNLSCRIVRNEERKSGGREHLKVSEHVEGLYESALLIKYVDLNHENELLEEYLISPQEAKINVLVSCVLMETVATCGHQLGPERYQQYVFRILFNLLSSAGNSNFCIHSAGLLALTETTRIYGLNGIRDLIMNNSDYVMFFVNQSLRDAHRSKSALDVISVILEFCSKDVVGYVELIVNRLLEECSKYHRMVNLSAYLKIFGLFLKNLTAEAGDNDGTDAKSVEVVLDAWLSILNPKPIEEDFNDTLNEANEGEEESRPEDPIPEETAVKTPPPKNVEIAQQIMKVALKHISSRNQSEVLAAMETLTWGVSILKLHEDELLPLVHLIWAPLSRRFTDENPVVLRNAFRMLITLADSAKEFIHRRTVDEVVPTLNKILKSSWTIVAKTKEDGGGRFTQQFKLVQEILSNYHIVIMRLNIQQKHLDDILSTVALYLDRQSPKALSVAAREFFEALKSFDGATVYQKILSCPPREGLYSE